MTPSPFGVGMNDGVWNRPDASETFADERDRAKYSEGYVIGQAERAAGALEPDVDQ